MGIYPSGKYKSFTTRDNVFVIEEKMYYQDTRITSYYFFVKNKMPQETEIILHCGPYITLLLLPG